MTIYRQSGDPLTLALPAELTKIASIPALIHQVVVAEAANARAPHGHTKTRADVRGGGHKPWRQKGTGRARASSNRSPLWPGGGISFGPKPERNFSKAINTTMRRRAFAMALAAQFRAGRVIAVESWQLAMPKTKEFAQQLRAAGVTGRRALLVVSASQSELILAARNIVGLEITTPAAASVRSLLVADQIILDRTSLEALLARIGLALPTPPVDKPTPTTRPKRAKATAKESV